MSPVAPARASALAPADELVGHQVVADEGHPAGRPGRRAGTGRARRPGAPAPRRRARRTDRPRRPNPTSRPCPACRPRPCRPRPAAGCATVPASIVVVTPWVTASTQARVADSSSSSAVCAACTGTAQEKIASPAGRSSGIDERIRRSPVRCWWALTKPGVTTAPGPPRVGTPGWRRAASARSTTPRIVPSATRTAASTRTVRAVVHREHVVAGHDEVRDLEVGGVGRSGTVQLEWSDGQTMGGHS